MLTFSQFLSERRSNPELNNDRRLLVDKILSYKNHPDAENIGISFTSIPKFGINPKSDFNTPLGIYAYPINYIISNIDSKTNRFRVPFAGDRSYYFIFKVNTPSKMLNVQKATKSDLNNVINLFKKYNEDNPLTPFDIDNALIRTKQFYNNSINGALIFGLTRYFSMHINKKLDQPLTRTWGFALDKIFGYVGVIDNGKGIIHSSERNQLFILKKEYGTLLDLGKNDRSNKEIDQPDSYYNLHRYNYKNYLHTKLLDDLSSLEIIDTKFEKLKLPLTYPIKTSIIVKNNNTEEPITGILNNKFFIDLFTKINKNYDLIYNNQKIRYLLSLAFYFPNAIPQRDKPKLVSYYREKTNGNILDTLYSVISHGSLFRDSFSTILKIWKPYLTNEDINNAKVVQGPAWGLD